MSPDEQIALGVAVRALTRDDTTERERDAILTAVVNNSPIPADAENAARALFHRHEAGKFIALLSARAGLPPGPAA